MSFGGQQNPNDQRSVAPILRLLDEFDQYSRSTDNQSRSINKMTGDASFTPKFDLKEDNDAYSLFGEFPGIDQKDIDIEFTEASTLTIKGHTTRECDESGSNAGSKKIPSPPRLEDCPDEDAPGWPKQNVQSKVSPDANKTTKATEKFWIKERSRGNFSRTFAFPSLVDQDNVKASMRNGILSVIVPKAKKQAGRKITIG